MPARLVRTALMALAASAIAHGAPIDRFALVTRHNPTITAVDASAPFMVGNGNFAFTADITGLQTFQDQYSPLVPLMIQSQWAWHSFPNPEGFTLDQALVPIEVRGRKRKYPYLTMTATRLDEPEKAVDLLLRGASNFTFGISGMTPRVHLDQNVAELLANAAPGGTDGPGYRRAAETYFPSNGSLLLAVALMVAGGSDVHELNPGFPSNGQWMVRSEGINPLP